MKKSPQNGMENMIKCVRNKKENYKIDYILRFLFSLFHLFFSSRFLP